MDEEERKQQRTFAARLICAYEAAIGTLEALCATKSSFKTSSISIKKKVKNSKAYLGYYSPGAFQNLTIEQLYISHDVFAIGIKLQKAVSSIRRQLPKQRAI